MRELDQIRATRGGCPTGNGSRDLRRKPAGQMGIPRGRSDLSGRRSGRIRGALRSAYRACLQLAEEKAANTSAFRLSAPEFTDIPCERRRAIALDEVIPHLKEPGRKLQRVVFVLFDDRTSRHMRRRCAGSVRLTGSLQ